MKQIIAAACICCLQLFGQVANTGHGKAPALLLPDARFKADLLLIIAHPDDDTLLAGYLAKLVLDEHKRVAVIYCTSGSGGGNAIGYAAGTALGQMRVIEAKRALESIGIQNVWFLGARDTPGQNVLWSLDDWGHGRMLEEIVRLVRITRPEVIVTWLPDYDVGENHGDHQAAGVLATEAFDAAGDPLRFPEQVTAPRDRQGIANLAEGLQPWQTKKLYYQTDAFENMNPYWNDASELPGFRKSMLDGTGPVYSMTEISASRHESYAKLFAEEQAFYATQGGAIGSQALAKNDVKAFEYPAHLIFGKSVVGGSITGDVFECVTDQPVSFVPVPGFRSQKSDTLSLELGGSWKFYQEFWKAHALADLAKLIPNPEASVDFGHSIFFPMLLSNQTASQQEIQLTAILPSGWTNRVPYDTYPVRPGETYPIEAWLVAPDGSKPNWQQITFKAKAAGREIGTVTIRVYVGKTGGLPQ
jgi:LmbE family N-acetylglucosaminyl deacetylase